MSGLIRSEADLRKAEAALMEADPLLGELIRTQKLKPRTPRSDFFAALSGSIISQQVSVAAAAAIAGRFKAATAESPAKVLSLTDEELRAIGLSRQKAGYLRDLAQHFTDDPRVYDHLDAQSDEQVISELTAVKGIGVWTAQMFLMFTLNRADVFAPDDVGLQRAIQRLFDLEQVPDRRSLEEIALRWRPYRTVACWHLWHSLDNAPA